MEKEIRNCGKEENGANNNNNNNNGEKKFFSSVNIICKFINFMQKLFVSLYWVVNTF